MRLYVAAVAALTLVFGFAVAQATGVRAYGGVFLVLGWIWCARQWWRRCGVAVAIALTALSVAMFALSHLLAGPLGAWPAVILVAVLMGGGSYALTAWMPALPAAPVENPPITPK